MCSEGVSRFSTRTTPLRTVDVVVSCAEMGTIPGQSMRYIRRMSVIYCQTYSRVSRSIKSGYAFGQREGKYLGFSRDRRNLAYLVFLKTVDDGRLAHIGIPNEADGNLLLVRMKHRELPEELN